MTSFTVIHNNKKEDYEISKVTMQYWIQHSKHTTFFNWIEMFLVL